MDLIISDLHFNPRRGAGTTMETRVALEEWLLDSFEGFLTKTGHSRLIILGDLLDKVSVSEKTIKRLVQILSKEEEIILVRGNHDEKSSRYGEISSLELISALLPNSTLVFHETVELDQYYIIPHLFNQEAFDLAIEAVSNNKTVLLHCNLNNSFASGDHSLNITDQQVKGLLEKGCEIIMGHEHGSRDLYSSRVKVLGCAWPTSIADCLGGSKRALLGGESIETWDSSDYQEFHFTEDYTGSKARFISITGECQKTALVGVIRGVASFRAKSDAFIIKNGVKPPEADKREIDQEVTKLNIMEIFLGEIPEIYTEKVRSCI